MAVYKIFVNGKMINENTSGGYEVSFQRALGIAIYLGMINDFENHERGSGKVQVIDTWVSKENKILVSKEQTQEELDNELFLKFLRELETYEGSENKDWICSDEDNEQYYRKAGRYSIEFSERGYSRVLNLNDLNRASVIESIKGYYNNFENLMNVCNQDTSSILHLCLECYWETHYAPTQE